MKIWVLAVVLMALVALQNALLSRRGIKKLQYERRLSKKTACVGETIEMIETLRNPSVFFFPWVRVESRVSPYLLFGRQENLNVAGEKYKYHKSVFSLMPFQQIRRRHQVKAMKRGEYNVGTVAITAGSLISDTSVCEEMDFDTKITVFPALIPPDQLPNVWPMARQQGDVIVPRQHQADPFLVCGIRPYQYGDNPRDIHWSATARTGQMQVKVHDFTADTRLMILLNGQMRPDQWDNLMDYEQETVEYGISLAASMMIHVLKSGGSAGFGSNIVFGNEEKCAFMPPVTGFDTQESVLEAMAKLKIHQARSFLSFLDERSTLQDCDILILSPYQDEALTEKMQQLAVLNRSVRLHLMDVKGGKNR